MTCTSIILLGGAETNARRNLNLRSFAEKEQPGEGGKIGQKQIYGDMEEFLKELRSEGVVREIHYIADIEKKASVPAFVTAPWMIRNAGLIYGIK